MMYIGFVWVCALLLRISSAHYTQQWAIHISGGKHVADKVATDHGFVNLGEIFPEYYHFSHRGVAKRSARPHDGHRIRLAVDERVHWAKQQKAKSRKKRDFKLLDSDPRWPNMWYLNRGNGLDMNVIPAWLEGITGKGAVVTILDDGLEKDHPDLIQNYDPLASYDVNSHDSDPSPRYDMIDSNRHGTRCAGEVAATSNNSVCALGIAHGAQVGGVRMLDGDVTDAVEARSLSLNPQHIDIYSASWGPDDDGKTVDGPGELATRAFVEGVTKGRGGKGSIFVWASGNGGRDHDNCNCDGYTNSIYSLSISSATEQGHVPWYSEACSSTLASTYSSGALGERQVITTDLHHSCTNSHTGTSASAPLAAGICALTLQANPSLTWRDMQHIVVRTARPGNLIAADWQTNGVGRNVSHSFGYGLMDAYAMVKLAKKWITVPEQYRCEITAPQVDKLVPAKSVVVLKLSVTECKNVEILEHVQAKLSIYAQRRGDLHIQLTSPMGTKVTLLAHRLHDTSRLGFNHWPFMSVHSWGESPFGTWQLEIHNDGRLLAELLKWELILHGTETLPTVDAIPVPVPKVVSTMPKMVSTSTIVDVDHNSIDDNDNWKVTSQIHDEGMVESQFQKTTVDHNANSSSCVRSNSCICLGLCLAVTFLIRLHMLIINDCGVLRQSILHTIVNTLSYTHSTITNAVQYVCYTVNTMQYLFNTVQYIGNTVQYMYNSCTEFTIHSFLLLINAIAFIYNRIKTSLTLLLVSIACYFEFQLLRKQKLHNEQIIVISTFYSNKSRDITHCIRRIFHHFPIRITVDKIIQRILSNHNEKYIANDLPCSSATNQQTYRRRFNDVLASFLCNWFNKSVPCDKS